LGLAWNSKEKKAALLPKKNAKELQAGSFKEGGQGEWSGELTKT